MTAEPTWAQELAAHLTGVLQLDRSGAWRSASPVDQEVSVRVSMAPYLNEVRIVVKKVLDGDPISYEIALSPGAIASSSLWAPIHRGKVLSEIPHASIALVVAVHMIDEPWGDEFIDQRDGRNVFRY